jgi:hypothetical protein
MEKYPSALLISPRNPAISHHHFFIIRLSASEQSASSLYWKRDLLSE